MKNHVEVNVSVDDDFTPLHMAALNDNAEMVELLLSFGADPNAIYTRKKPRDMTSQADVILLFDNFK